MGTPIQNQLRRAYSFKSRANSAVGMIAGCLSRGYKIGRFDQATAERMCHHAVDLQIAAENLKSEAIFLLQAAKNEQHVTDIAKEAREQSHKIIDEMIDSGAIVLEYDRKAGKLVIQRG